MLVSCVQYFGYETIRCLEQRLYVRVLATMLKLTFQLCYGIGIQLLELHVKKYKHLEWHQIKTKDLR